MLSVVVDDNDMGVNSIIRGDDHLNNTFRQIHIYKHLNWEIPKYSHIPLIHGSDGKKLSKRHGSVDISDLKNLGYLPQSIINNLILLGWSPKNKNEIIEINEIIKEIKHVISEWYACSPDIYRAMPSNDLKKLILKETLSKAEAFESVDLAIKEAVKKDSTDIVIVFGSFFTVSEAYESLSKLKQIDL